MLLAWPVGINHVNTNYQLLEEMKAMRKRGVVSLMAAEMPVECMIIDKCEEFVKLLSFAGGP